MKFLKNLKPKKFDLNETIVIKGYKYVKKSIKFSLNNYQGLLISSLEYHCDFRDKQKCKAKLKII